MTITRKRFLIAASFLCVLSGAIVLPVAFAQDGEVAKGEIDEAFRADILKMLTLTGSDKMGEQVLDTMIPSLKQEALNVPEDFWAAIREELDMGELIVKLVPIYAKHLTHEDVKATIAFYETPAGKNLLNAQPKIVADSMPLVQQWGQEMAAKIVTKLQQQQQAQD